jgi:outer membrane protein assembly factor BamB
VACADGKVYFVNQFYAACSDAKNGEVLWESSLGYVSYSSPAYADGKVYFCSDAYIIYCFDAKNGTRLSLHEIGSNIHSSPSIAYGNLYVGFGDWNICCFSQAYSNQPITKTVISSVLSSSQVEAYTSVTVKGAIIPSPTLAPQVVAAFTRPDGTTITVSEAANAEGTYEISYSPNVEGIWTVKVSWSGNDQYEGSASSDATFSVILESPSTPSPSVDDRIPIRYLYVVLVLTAAILLVIAAYFQFKKRRS